VLEDGTTLKVAEGKVAEIVEAEPVAEETPEEAEDVASIKAENESLKAEVAELKKQIETLQAQPMAMAAHEEVTTTQTFKATGDKGLDRLARVLKA
jgi:predicted RNase H-like nuclease (RuvC/YqgF family)